MSWRAVLLLGAALTLARGLLATLVTPPWQRPDEPGHYELVALIEELGRIPEAGESLPALTRAINESARSQHFERFQQLSIDDYQAQDPPQLIGPREVGYQYPFYYQVLAGLFPVLPDAPVLSHYYALALASSLLGVIVVVLTGLAARALFQGRLELVILTMLVVLLWPSRAFLAGGINNDNLAILTGAWGAWATVRLFRTGPRWFDVLNVLAAAGLSVLTKRTTIILAGWLVGCLIWRIGLDWLGRQPERRQRQWRRTALLTAFLIGLGVLFVWSSRGLAVVVAAWLETSPWDGARYLGAVLRFAPLDLFSRPNLARLEGYLGWLPSNFWAGLGWGTLQMPGWTYGVAGLGAVLSLLGWGVFLVTGRRRLSLEPWQGAALTGFAASVVLVSAPALLRTLVELSYSDSGLYGPGRYLLTIVAPMSILVVFGWSRLVPERYWAHLTHFGVAGLILLDAVALGLTVIPYYYR